MKILIVKACALAVKTCPFFLKRSCENVGSVDGLDASEEIAPYKSGTIIFGIKLPYFPVLQISGKVKQTSDPVPAIVVSPIAQPSVIHHAMEWGEGKATSKPFRISKLPTDFPSFCNLTAIAS